MGSLDAQELRIANKLTERVVEISDLVGMGTNPSVQAEYAMLMTALSREDGGNMMEENARWMEDACLRQSVDRAIDWRKTNMEHEWTKTKVITVGDWEGRLSFEVTMGDYEENETRIERMRTMLTGTKIGVTVDDRRKDWKGPAPRDGMRIILRDKKNERPCTRMEGTCDAVDYHNILEAVEEEMKVRLVVMDGRGEENGGYVVNSEVLIELLDNVVHWCALGIISPGGGTGKDDWTRKEWNTEEERRRECRHREVILRTAGITQEKMEVYMTNRGMGVLPWRRSMTLIIVDEDNEEEGGVRRRNPGTPSPRGDNFERSHKEESSTRSWKGSQNSTALNERMDDVRNRGQVVLMAEGDRLKEDVVHAKFKVHGKDWYVVMQGSDIRRNATIEDDIEDLLEEMEIEIMADDIGSVAISVETTDYGMIWGEDGYVLTGEYALTVNDLRKMMEKGTATMKVAGGPRDGETHNIDMQVIKETVDRAESWIAARILYYAQRKRNRLTRSKKGGQGSLIGQAKKERGVMGRTQENLGITEIRARDEAPELWSDEDMGKYVEMGDWWAGVKGIKHGEIQVVTELCCDDCRWSITMEGLTIARDRSESTVVNAFLRTELGMCLLEHKFRTTGREPMIVMENSGNGYRMRGTIDVLGLSRMCGGGPLIARMEGGISDGHVVEVEAEVVLDIITAARAWTMARANAEEQRLGHDIEKDEDRNTPHLTQTEEQEMEDERNEEQLHTQLEEGAENMPYVVAMNDLAQADTPCREISRTNDGIPVRVVMGRGLGEDKGTTDGDMGARGKDEEERSKGCGDHGGDGLLKNEDDEGGHGDEGPMDMEEMNIEQWMDKNKLGKKQWYGSIINNEDCMVLRWHDGLDQVKLHVETAERSGKFWYAKWGKDAVVAARIGTRTHARMMKIGEMMGLKVTDNDHIPRGNFEVLSGEEMEKQWEQEMYNMAMARGIGESGYTRAMRINEEDMMRATGGPVKRYAVVIHLDRGIVEHPDEIEWRRRDEEKNWTRQTNEWTFRRYDDWMVASKDEWEQGNWNRAEDINGRLALTKISPDTDEYGPGIDMEWKEGMGIMDRIDGEGGFAEPAVKVRDGLTFNERIQMIGIGGEVGDGTFIADAVFELSEDWEEQPEDRMDQLLRCARISLRMYKISGSIPAPKGANIILDFNEEKGDVWIRTREDRSGGGQLEMKGLTSLCGREEVVAGFRVDGKVKKTIIKSNGLKDILQQILVRVEGWANGAFVWGAKAKEVIDLDDQDKEIEQQQGGKPFIAGGALIFGFTREALTSHTKENIMTVAMDRAKYGLRGGLPMKKAELTKRMMSSNKGLVSLSSLGLEGVRDELFGILVEFVNGIMVGKVEGHGIPIYDWVMVKKEIGGRKVKLGLSRQMLSEVEMRMALNATTTRQDYALVAGRGMVRVSAIDDILRRSFQAFLDHEVRLKTHVWIAAIRHNDERGMPRDEPILLGMLSEAGGKKLGDRLMTGLGGNRRGMMLLEGIDLQVFKDARLVWNTSKPSMVGRTKKTLRVVAPEGCDTKMMCDVLREAGITRVHMMAKITRAGPKMEVWMVVPAMGERLSLKSVERGENKWDMEEADRAQESNKEESGRWSWDKGVKRESDHGVIDSDSSVSSITTGTTDLSQKTDKDTAQSTLLKTPMGTMSRMENGVMQRTGKLAEGSEGTVMTNWKDPPTEGSVVVGGQDPSALRADLMNAIKEGCEVIKADLEKEIAVETGELRMMMREMMEGIKKLQSKIE